MNKNILRKHCWCEDWYGCVFSKMYFVLTINIYMYIFPLDIDNKNLQKKKKSLVIPFGIYFVTLCFNNIISMLPFNGIISMLV